MGDEECPIWVLNKAKDGVPLSPDHLQHCVDNQPAVYIAGTSNAWMTRDAKLGMVEIAIEKSSTMGNEPSVLVFDGHGSNIYVSTRRAPACAAAAAAARAPRPPSAPLPSLTSHVTARLGVPPPPPPPPTTRAAAGDTENTSF